MNNIEVTVHVIGFAVGGRCIGTVTDGPADLIGLKAFLGSVIPGETVLAEVVKRHQRYLDCKLIEIKAVSENRASPACRYFNSCGGCDYQHIDIQTQRALKVALVEQSLLRQGRLVPRLGVDLIGEDLPALGYRRRITLQVAPNGSIGFFQRGSSTVVPVSECLISDPVINWGINSLSKLPADQTKHFSQILLENRRPVHSKTLTQIDSPDDDCRNYLQVVLRTRDTRNSKPGFLKAAWFNALVEQYPDLELHHKNQILFKSNADTLKSGSTTSESQHSSAEFSQVNPFANALLVDHVISQVSHSKVTDLYAGAGNFSLPLATAGFKVALVELEPRLVQSANTQAQKLELRDRFKSYQMSCDEFVTRHKLSETVILDPPRRGAKEVVEKIETSLVVEVIYVSCELSTLIRDLKTLVDKGYALEHVALIDMFPQTGHVELVAKLVAKSAT